MQGHRRLARLSCTAAALLIGLALVAQPAAAQRRGGGRPPGGGAPPGGPDGGAPAGSRPPAASPEPAPETQSGLTPIALFSAACTGEGVRLTRKEANPITAEQLAPDARRALRDSVAGKVPAGAVAPLDAADLPNTIYQIGETLTYLIAPAPDSATGPMAESCTVAWRGDDFMDARQLIYPDQKTFDLPLTARPESRPNGAIVVSAVRDRTRLTLSSYNGWNTLRYSPVTPPTGATTTPGAQ
jgi:hypothetical protein